MIHLARAIKYKRPSFRYKIQMDLRKCKLHNKARLSNLELIKRCKVNTQQLHTEIRAKQRALFQEQLSARRQAREAEQQKLIDQKRTQEALELKALRKQRQFKARKMPNFVSVRLIKCFRALSATSMVGEQSTDDSFTELTELIY